MFFDRSAFTYELDSDTFRCPAGRASWYGAITSREGQPVYGLKFAVPVVSLGAILPLDVSSSPVRGTKQAAEIIHVSDALSRAQTDHALTGDTAKSYRDSGVVG